MPQAMVHSDETQTRLRLVVRGAVQGVGFRPFVYRLAQELGLPGWVTNTADGVLMEVEGQPTQLESFQLRLEQEQPSCALIQSLEPCVLAPAGYTTFTIRPSQPMGAKSALILPDIATCPDCLRELFDPGDRRYRYPFINCTHCGPRFTIIWAIPYDRQNTTMSHFSMCDACRSEYESPLDRRFHAQPIACPDCGPQLELWGADGSVLARREDALGGAVAAIRQGKILAVKGLGGFHLLTAAHQTVAVERLRVGKGRAAKPFALMYPNLAQIEAHCVLSPLERDRLSAREAPIVLLRRRPHPDQFPPLPADSVAPDNPYLGVMLPANPLHHLLMADLGFPVVATSGNFSAEPICIDESEALARLGSMADLFLVHNRPIARHVDDSITRIILGQETILRRARGYTPLPITLSESAFPNRGEDPLLAVGAQMKNSAALAVGRNVFLTQPVGDLENAQAYRALPRVIADFETLFGAAPVRVACDLHPDYQSTRLAEKRDLPLVRVQHHHAHALSCMAEHSVCGPALGVAWDGTGFGPDGTVWGGEFLRINGPTFTRVAHFRTFPLPGGEQAIRQPRRTGLGLLYAHLGERAFQLGWLSTLQAFSVQELKVLRQMLARQLNIPFTSSVGRLFDGVASLLGILQLSDFEGQAAMALEYALHGVATEAVYPFVLQAQEAGVQSPIVIDWGPMLDALLADCQSQTPIGVVAAKFHNSMAAITVAVAQQIGDEQVLLTGGCFQNCYLLTRTALGLQRAGFRPIWHQRVPPNDGGIALGQILAAVLTER